MTDPGDPGAPAVTAAVIRLGHGASSPRSLIAPHAPALVDTEGLALRDVARGLDEPVVRVRRRLHRARMIVREALTAYFAAATTPD